MDERINIRANGNMLTKDYGAAGTQGEVNSTKLVITFAENWDGFAKKITFWNAVGENPVDIQLGTDLLEDVANPRVYIVPVPGEAMTEAGECTFVIEGTTDDAVKRSIEGKLKVIASRSATDAEVPSGVTPDLAEQLRLEIDSIIGNIAEVKVIGEECQASIAVLDETIATARGIAADAQTSADDAQASAEEAAAGAKRASDYVTVTQNHKWEAQFAAQDAETYKNEAQKAKQAIENMSVSSETIGVGEEATVEKEVTDGVVNLHFGIPKGEPGIKVGWGAPPDEVVDDDSVKAWIDLTGEASSEDSDEEPNVSVIVRGGVPMISVHDEACNTLVPEDGAMYVVKYDNVEASDNHVEPDENGEYPTVVTDTVRYRLVIGDGVHTLAELPVMSNIQAGTGNGSLVLIDPTYDEGEDCYCSPSEATAQLAVALGKYLSIRARTAAGVGYANEITENGQRSFVGGANNLIDAERAFALAYKAVIKGVGSAIFGGTENTTEANTGTIIGGSGNYLGKAAKCSILLGSYLHSNTERMVGLGKYNEDDADALVVIGAGQSDEERKNAIAVKKDGAVEITTNVAKDTVIYHNLYTDALGRYSYTPMSGDTKEETASFLMYGHSDVVTKDANSYTEFPAEDSDSDRLWAYLGSVGGQSLSNGLFVTLGDGSRATFCMTDKDEWTAFRLKIPEDGVYSVTMDYSAYSRGGIIRTYILPMTEAIEAEFASNNTETYGSLYTDKACTTLYDEETYTSGYLYRSGAKMFGELESIGKAKSIGEALDTTGESTSDSFVYDKKIGAIDATAGEYLLLFRNLRDSALGNLRIKNIKLVKFEPLTDSIKIGDTTVTEEQMKKLLALVE